MQFGMVVVGAVQFLVATLRKDKLQRAQEALVESHCLQRVSVTVVHCALSKPKSMQAERTLYIIIYSVESLDDFKT